MITADDVEFMDEVVHRIAKDLCTIVDRSFAIDQVESQRVTERPVGDEQVHISFRLSFNTRAGSKEGCVLLPLSEAITLAGYMMMIPDAEVDVLRQGTTLDGSTKDAMLELGRFMAGAVDVVVRKLRPTDLSVRSEGCQGVRPAVRPALAYVEGEELVVARAQGRLEKFPPFEFIVMLPDVRD